MASVFRNAQTHKGSFKRDGLSVVIAGQPVAGLLMQQIGFNFAQQVSMMYELGSNFVYTIVGNAQGQASIANVLGPGGLQARLLGSYGDACNPKDLTLEASARQCQTGAPTTGQRYNMKRAFSNSIGGNIDVNDNLMRQSLQLQYFDLDVGDGVAA